MKPMYKLFFMFLNFAWSLTVFAQSPLINTTRRLSREGDKLFIEYDLIRNNSSVKAYSIALNLKLDGAAIEDPKGLSGHIGQVNPGNGKRITWDMDTDLGRVAGEVQIELSVTEIKAPCIPINTTPVYTSIGTGLFGGAGFLVLGLGQLNKYKEPYQYYGDHQNPEDTNFYGSGKPYPSRDAAYHKANKHYLNGLVYMSSGGVLIASGVTMVVQLIKIKRYNKSCELGGNAGNKDTSFRVIPTLLNGNINQPGIQLSHRF